MRRLIGLFIGLVLLAIPGLATAQPPVWVVKDADSTIVLFGSVHILPPGLDWRPPVLEDAISHADDLWFEVPFDAASQLAAQRAALAHGFLPAGQTLSSLLSTGDRKRLQKVAKTFGLSLPALDRFQPWFADLTISAATYQKAGGEGEDGVERQLSASAPGTAKREAFETPEQQIGFFADAPLKEQLASLDETLKDAGDAEHDYKKLVDAWMRSDTRMLDREAVEHLRKASPTLYATLVSERNARWTQAIIQRLHGHGHTVIVVGVGHLVGKDSVPNRLRALGVDVEGPR